MASRKGPWPATIVTDRLVLRPVEPADVPAVSRLMTDPDVRRYLGGPVAPDELARREQGCVRAANLFSVVRRSDQAILGLVVIDPDTDPDGPAGGDAEVSYQFLPEYWGRGYGRESVSAAIAWTFTNVTPVPSAVVAITQEANKASRHLLESIGMTLQARFIAFDAWQVKYTVSYSVSHEQVGGP